ncbi:hypothetical protein M6D93_15490 [Jatrophihabitans telluris]|uniref:Mce-associated membrane protein n=1 Tax=Jatrophihabitans telluris TaxID=2038343 RepID=A0ABY4QVQ1_9ACTN|nr:hypothetical protein [Jatrophihabitans telluris]UQX87694.1 hypothetical protein M6D93_15490 [Jatrophihabitans telluris]
MTVLEAPVVRETESTVPEGTDRTPQRTRLGSAIPAAVPLAVLAVVLAALLGVLLVVDQRPSRPSLSRSEVAAMNAAPGLLDNFTTYRRASFEADWQRCLSSLTGDIKTQQQARKASTLKALTTSKADLQGQVGKVAVAGSSGHSVQLVAVLTGYQVQSATKKTVISTSQLSVTLTDVSGTWLISDLANTGVS